MKLLRQLFLIIIIYLIVKIKQIETANEKLKQKSFDEIFGEKWEEKEEEKRKDEKKREIIGKYYKIKEKIKEKGIKYSTKEWIKIEKKIEKKIGTNRIKIYKWIKELGLNQKTYKSHKSKSDDEKIEIVQKFNEMANKYKQKRKYSAKEWRQNYAEISEKLGVSSGTISKWKKQFGIRCKITENEKMEIMKMYCKTKKENPKMSDHKIAEMINTSAKNICIWKAKFGEKIILH